MATPVTLSIGALARAASVNIETIRFYHRKGLLARPARPERGVRRYPQDSVARVQFIKAAQSWGFSLHEIADLLKLHDGTGCEEARRIAEGRLVIVKARLRDLRRMEAALRSAIADCARRKGRVSCPLIAMLRVPGPPHATG